MRQLKFRVWDKILKSFLFDHRGSGLFFSRHSDATLGDLSVSEFILDKDSIAQQSTGLKDKNGKEIYEGDLIQEYCLPDEFGEECDNPIHDVVFGKYGSCSMFGGNFNYIGFSIGYLDPDKQSDVFNHPEKYKVVGNIFENPELL